jgi:hypothetical protein
MRSTIIRWCNDRPEFKREYDIAVQLRADGLLEETIDIIDDKKEIVTEMLSKMLPRKWGDEGHGLGSTKVPFVMSHGHQ